MKIEIKSRDMVNSVIKDLLYAHECDQIIKALPIRQLEEHKSKKPKTTNSGMFEIQEWTDVRVMKKYVINFYIFQCMVYEI